VSASVFKHEIKITGENTLDHATRRDRRGQRLYQAHRRNLHRYGACPDQPVRARRVPRRLHHGISQQARHGYDRQAGGHKS
jgi:hypothetical protein